MKFISNLELRFYTLYVTVTVIYPVRTCVLTYTHYTVEEPTCRQMCGCDTPWYRYTLECHDSKFVFEDSVPNVCRAVFGTLGEETPRYVPQCLFL